MTRLPKKQTGIALIVGLLMLLLLTIIMVSAVQVTSLEQRMASNLQNNNVAFQAAEIALREAEALILNSAASKNPVNNPFYPLRLYDGPFQNTTTPICVDGICGVSSPLQSDPSVFPAVDGEITESGNLGVRTAVTDIATVDTQPIYIIELINVEPSIESERVYATFRITARAWAADNSVVQLQSTYRLHAPWAAY